VNGPAANSPESEGDWPAARHRELLDGLGRHLDPEAGLRDMMLHAEHAGLTGTLGRHLDTQAGLAAILPPRPAASLATPGQAGTAAAIAAADPAARMTLRRDPVVLAAILSDLTVRALTIADKTNDHDPGLPRDLERACGLARRMREFGGFARDLDRAVTRALERDHEVDRHHVSGLVSDLARAIYWALDTSFSPTARDLARRLASYLIQHDSVRRDFDRHLVVARDLAQRTALMVGGALGLRQAEGLAAELLEGALDDFTHADLARADLAGRDLTGIRWSDQGTKWPPGTDIDELRARSREIALGIYEITRPGHDNKARHHTPA